MNERSVIVNCSLQRLCQNSIKGLFLSLLGKVAKTDSTVFLFWAKPAPEKSGFFKGGPGRGNIATGVGNQHRGFLAAGSII